MARSQRVPRIARAVALCATLFGAAFVTGTPNATAAGRGGYGAAAGQWVRAHPVNSAHCRIGTCYGLIVSSRPEMPQYSFVTMASHRVIGYQEALRRGTSLLEAQLQIAEQFPADTTISRKVTLISHDRYGRACAIYDLYSQALATEFGKDGPGHSGNSIGVELLSATTDSSHFNPNAITLAIVAPVYLDSSTNC
jgi:hypothetical protein